MANSWGGTRQGSTRSENQDCWGLDQARGLFVVSDGMGGHAGGAKAAAMVVKTMLQPPEPGVTRHLDPADGLRHLVGLAHGAAVGLAAELGHQDNMGATLICLWLHESRYLMAAVGDSRGFLWRDGALTQISTDHTLVSEYLRQGLISPSEARTHPQRNVISQAMGVGEVHPDVFTGELHPGDAFVLVSDGVSEVLEHDDLAEILRCHTSPQAVGQTVLRTVERHNGDDDATVVVVSV